LIRIFRFSAGSTISTNVTGDFARRGKPISRVVMAPSAFEPMRTRNPPDARAQAAPHRQSPAVAGERDTPR